MVDGSPDQVSELAVDPDVVLQVEPVTFFVRHVILVFEVHAPCHRRVPEHVVVDQSTSVLQYVLRNIWRRYVKQELCIQLFLDSMLAFPLTLGLNRFLWVRLIFNWLLLTWR